MANAIAKLGTEKSWIVHGKDGLDEISISSRTFVAEATNGKVREFTIGPANFGLESNAFEVAKAESPAESAKTVRQVLSLATDDCAARNLVLINAAAAIFVSGHCEKLVDAIEVARASIHSGKAMQKLEAFVKFRAQ
jgi:anthranilate phosphoribosyltransferase